MDLALKCPPKAYIISLLFTVVLLEGFQRWDLVESFRSLGHPLKRHCGTLISSSLFQSWPQDEHFVLLCARSHDVLSSHKPKERGALTMK